MEIFSPRSVQQAAVFLDRNLPGWETYINLDRLDMPDPHNCVLAQLWQEYLAPGSWGDNTATQGITPWDKALKALLLGNADAFADNTEEWISAIKARLVQPPVRDLAAL